MNTHMNMNMNTNMNINMNMNMNIHVYMYIFCSYWFVFQDINVADDTANGLGVDYSAPATTANFAAGEDVVDMTFDIVTDTESENLESFTVTLESPVDGVISTPEPETTKVYIVDETSK